MLDAWRRWWRLCFRGQDPGCPNQPKPHTTRSVAVLMSTVGVAIGLLLALLEIDRLIASIPDQSARVASLGEVTGPMALSVADRWARWAPNPDVPVSVAELARIYASIDFVFIVAYAFGFFLLLRRGWLSRVAVVALTVVVTADLVENAILLWVLDPDLSDTSGLVRYAIATSATVKWVALLSAVVAIVRNERTRAVLARAARLAGTGLRWQRVTAVALALLAVLSLVPLGDLFDQLPDVQRQWLDSLPGLARQLGAAALSTALFTVAAFYVGRRRSERAHKFYVSHEELDESPLVGWLVVLALFGAVGGSVLVAVGGDGRWIDHRQIWTFLSVVLGAVVVSVFFRCLGPRTQKWAPRVDISAEEDDGRAQAVRWTGDVLAIATLVIGCLSLVRSMTVVLVLPPTAEGRSGWATGLVVGAAAVLVVVPFVSFKLIERVQGAAVLDVTEYRPRSGRVVDTAVGLVAVVVALAFALFPICLGGLIGVTATTGILLAAWIVVLGLLVVHTQYHQPLEFFRFFRLQATPVLTLLVAIGIANAWAGGDRDLHALRLTGGTGTERVPPQVLLEDWARRSVPCDRLAADLKVRPMVLVAAAGGGIRASYWTENALRSLRIDPLRAIEADCAANAPVVSSGVSGGSVGLTLSRGHAAEPEDASTGLSQPDALAAATAGLLDADAVGNLTGLRVPSYAPDGTWDWRDRAALMEQVWERAAPDLLQTYPDGIGAPTGALVLNSTDAISGCRVLVSQVAWPGTTGTGCDDTSPRIGASVDLGTLLACRTDRPRWSTAAMLSARFPFVTPAGRTTSCPEQGKAPRALQLVDGGYAEGSGLGTLADIAPTVMTIVQRHNAAVLGGTLPGRLAGAPNSVIVPVVVFLDNHFGGDVLAEAPTAAVEAIVPLEGRSALDVQAGQQAWLQRLAIAVANPCDATEDERCRRAIAAVHASSGGVVTVAPSTQPAVAAPLGWVLSNDSRHYLDYALPAFDATRPDEARRGLSFLQSLLRNQP
ncbi:hypothetical protein [Actinomycetospora atypica]|uniref:PNPLA domain-containing protein n=1 Tax=Actinomycetospora atypica TaxID=1290095 RepID=A0ABV9YJJ0_9PSEU